MMRIRGLFSSKAWMPPLKPVFVYKYEDKLRQDVFIYVDMSFHPSFLSRAIRTIVSGERWV
jgi:hypothetical protein